MKKPRRVIPSRPSRPGWVLWVGAQRARGELHHALSLGGGGAVAVAALRQNRRGQRSVPPATPSHRGAVGESCRDAQGGALIPAPACPSNVAEQRATLGLRVCTRPGCSRAFEPRGSGGRPQEFCTAVCRRRFNDETRRDMRVRAKKRARRGQSVTLWGWGVDVATGRRIPVAVHPPLASLTAYSRHERAPLLGPLGSG